jgi:hypothetical protein
LAPADAGRGNLDIRFQVECAHGQGGLHVGLRSPTLAFYTAYNQSLSERRADAI